MKNLIVLLFLFSFAAFSANFTYIKGQSLIESSSSVATANGTTVLNSSSNMVQYFSGTLNQDVILPNTASLAIGTNFEIQNKSTGLITVKDFSNSTLQVIQSGVSVKFFLLDGLTWSFFPPLSKNLVSVSPISIAQNATTATFSIPAATSLVDGYLTSTDWSIFNSKQSALGFTPEQQLTFASPLNRSVNDISIPAATTATSGYLTSSDWNYFNGKLNGSGTTNKVAKFSDTATLTDSQITDDGSLVNLGKTAKLASGYLYDGSFVDGTFETGTNAGWTVGAGTLTATTSQYYKGVYSGLWSITGTGTIDLCTTLNNMSGSLVEGAGVVKSDSPDLQVCSVTNSVETGCTAIGSITGWKQLSATANATATGNHCFRLKHTGSGSVTASIDDVKLRPYTAQQGNIVEQESAKHVGTGLLTTTGIIIQPSTQIGTSIGNLVTYNQANGRFTATKKTTVFVNATYVLTVNGAIFTIRKNGITTLVSSSPPGSGGYQSSLGGSFEMSAGDYFDVYTASTISDNSNSFFSISATAISSNVIQSWQDGTEWTSYTPTFQGFGTVTNAAGKWKRSGSDLEVFVSCTTGNTAASLATVSLPSGLSIDASKLTINNTTSNPGNLVGTYNSAPALSGFMGNVITAPSTSTSLFYFGGQDNSSITHLIPVIGNVVTTNSAVFTFYAKVPIQGWSSAPQTIALPNSKENVFSAVINPDGTVASKSSDWLTSVKNSLGNYTLDYTKLGLTVPPSLVVTTKDLATANSSNSDMTTLTSSSSNIITYNESNSYADMQFQVVLQKQSPDYTPLGTIPVNINPDGYNQTHGTTGTIETFSFSYGTTNATTVCSASPCSYLDQIGDRVTSVTRGSAGNYTASFAKTFSKLKCTGSTSAGATTPRLNIINSCSSCSNIVIETWNTSWGAADAFGSIYCQGY